MDTIAPCPRRTSVIERRTSKIALYFSADGCLCSSGSSRTGAIQCREILPLLLVRTQLLEMATGLTTGSIFAKYNAIAAPSPGSPHGRESNALVRGALDKLRVCELADFEAARSFLLSQGDRAVHFSCIALEYLNDAMPLKRIFIITDRALYRLPQSSLDTGIYFKCRTPLTAITQVITSDNENDSAMVQVLGKVESSNSSMSDEKLQLFTIGFSNDVAIRKAMLLTICMVAPTICILQKRRVVDTSPRRAGSPVGDSKSGKPSTPKAATPVRASPRHVTPTSPAPRTPLSGASPYSPAALVSAEHEATPRKEEEISEKEFSEHQKALREFLIDHSAMSIGEYDPAKIVARPKEEANGREVERQAIRSMLEAREAKIMQSIEWKLKYPRKVATKVPSGVEFDKANEAQVQLPDNFSDEELLGPSLTPLWVHWRRSGGLLSELTAEREGEKGDEDEAEGKWTVFDSTDLIDSLRLREDALYGLVGPKAMYRLQHLREMVERERQLFLNKRNYLFAEEAKLKRITTPRLGDEKVLSASSFGSPPAHNSESRQRKRVSATTHTKPFNLSQSPTMQRRLKVMDSSTAIAEMKAKLEKHLKTLHAVRKEQLEREVAREAQ